MTQKQTIDLKRQVIENVLHLFGQTKATPEGGLTALINAFCDIAAAAAPVLGREPKEFTADLLKQAYDAVND